MVIVEIRTDSGSDHTSFKMLLLQFKGVLVSLICMTDNMLTLQDVALHDS